MNLSNNKVPANKNRLAFLIKGLNKMKRKKYYTVGTVPKSKSIIEELEAK